MDPNEKIQLDDITFDDVIAGDGVDTVSIDDTAEVETEETAEETTEEVVDEVEETEEEIEEEEYDEEEEDDDDDVEPSEKSDTVVGEILSALGYEVEEDYPDTAEGLTEMTKDITAEARRIFTNGSSNCSRNISSTDAPSFSSSLFSPNSLSLFSASAVEKPFSSFTP